MTPPKKTTRTRTKTPQVALHVPVMGHLAQMLARRLLLVSKGELTVAEQEELNAIGDIPPELSTEIIPAPSVVMAYDMVLEDMRSKGYDVKGDPNFHDTSRRAAKAMAELVWPHDRILAAVGQMMEKVFPGRYQGMVAQPNIFVPCICPHHLLPVMMRVTIGYVPKKRCVGISKLSRIAKAFGHQPIMQEEYTDQLCTLLQEGLDAKGVGVSVRGYHTCQAIRGAAVHDVVTVTTSLSGIFYNPQTRREFYDLASAGQQPIL